MGRRLIDVSLMEEAERYAEERMQREDCRLFVREICGAERIGASHVHRAVPEWDAV